MKCLWCKREMALRKRKDPYPHHCSLYCYQEWRDAPQAVQLDLFDSNYDVVLKGSEKDD